MAGKEADMGLAATMMDPNAVEDRGEEARVIERLIAASDYRSALERCATSYAGALGRLCMAFTGSQADSEELAQEVLIAAYDGFPQYRGEASVRAWLFGIARRVCAKHVEKRARRDARLRLVHDTGRAPGAEDLSLEHERAVRARNALSELKPSEREAVTLRYEAGLAFREVAHATGVDEATARKRVSRALTRMRSMIGEE